MSKSQIKNCTYTYNGKSYDYYTDALEVAISESRKLSKNDIILYSTKLELTQENVKNIIKNNNSAFGRSGAKGESIGITKIISGSFTQATDPIPLYKQSLAVNIGIAKHLYLEGILTKNEAKINSAIAQLSNLKTSLSNFLSFIYGTKDIFKFYFNKNEYQITRDEINKLSKDQQEILFNEFSGLDFNKEIYETGSTLFADKSLERSLILSSLGIKRPDHCEVMSEVEIKIPITELTKEQKEKIRNNPEYKDNMPTVLKGIIDLLVIDKSTKTIYIVDFKSHLKSTTGSEISDNKNFTQVYAYKDMLEYILSSKFPDLQIKVGILDISTDPTTGKNVLSKRSETIATSITPILEKKKITTEQLDRAESKANTLISAIENRAKDESKGRIEWIQKKYQTAKLGWKCSYYSNNDEKLIIILETSKNSTRDIPDMIQLANDNGKVIMTVPKDEFFQNEAKAQLTNRENRYKQFAKILSDIIYMPSEIAEEQNRIRDFEPLIWNDHSSNINHIYRNIIKYTYGSWEVEQNPVLLEHGIIPLYDRVHNTYDFIVIDALDRTGYREYNAPIEGALKGSTVLGNIMTDKQIFDNYTVPHIENTVGNRLLMSGIAVITSAMSTLQHSDAKVADVRIINTQNGVTYNKTNTYEDYKKYLNILANYDTSFEGLQQDVNNLHFQSHGQTILDELTSYAIRELDMEQLSKLNIHDKYQLINELKDKKEKFEAAYKSYLSQNKSSQQDISNQYTRVKQLLDDLLLYLEYGTVSPNRVSKRGVDTENSLGLIHSIFKTGRIARYAASGYTLCGFAQGYYYATAFNNPDNAVHATNQLIMNVISKLRSDIQQSNRELFEATDKFLNEKSNWLKQAVVGNNLSAYKSLFVLDKNGDISPSLVMLDPYSASMSKIDKEYLEVVLWNLNRIRYKNLTDEERSMTYAKFKTTTKFNDYKVAVKTDISLRNYPLMIRRGAKMPSMNISRDSFKKYFYDTINRWADYINPAHLTSRDIQKLDKSLNDLEMYTQYSDVDREEVINEHNVGAFEMNVERVVAEFSFANARKTYYDQTLKQVDSVIGFLMQYSAQTGEDVTATIKTIQDRIKIALFSHNIAEPDLKVVNGVIGSLKGLDSALKLGFRFTLFLKEMTVSTLKIFGQAKFGFFEGGNLSASNIMEAYKLVYSFKNGNPDNGMFDLAQMNKTNALNKRFGIADMDVNKTILKSIRDRWGLHNMFERLLYFCSTQPDYFNRNAIFTACMIKDGCYDAYEMKDGILFYDMAKDDRFRVFWRYKDDPSKWDDTFYKQRDLYYAYLDDFNKSGYNLRQGDKLPDCYPPSKKNSIMEQINTTLGAFDHELAANFQKSQYAIFFMQFKSYMAAMMKFCFATRNGNTCVGDFYVKKDEFGNTLYIEGIDPNTGEYIYTTSEFDEDGHKRQAAMLFENRGMEGIFISLLKTAKDILDPNSSFREKLKSDKWEDQQQIANTKVFLFYLGVYAMFGALGWLIADLIRAIKSKQPTDKLEKALLAEGAKFMERVGNEFSFWNSLAQPVLDMNIVGVATLEKTLYTTVDVITGDKHASKLFFDSVIALKDTHIPEIMGWD